MNTRRALTFFGAAVLLGAALPLSDVAQQTVNASARTVAALRGQMGRSLQPVLRRTQAIIVAPHGARGDAMLMVHDGTGWSEPAFFHGDTLGTAAPSVILVMTDGALDQILHQRGLTLDGPGALTVAPLTRHGTADLLTWPDLKPGADGLREDDETNAAWTGTRRSAPEIVGWSTPDLRTSALRRELEEGEGFFFAKKKQKTPSNTNRPSP